MRNQHPITVRLYGCGATGSSFARQLVRIQQILETVGIFMHVEINDFDEVMTHNIGKQAFYPKDVGSLKAVQMAMRINRTYGASWTCKQYDNNEAANIVIFAVDTVKARKTLYKNVEALYYLDIGNAEYHGQVVLKHKDSLPGLFDLFPKMEDKDEVPSCSVLESISKQALFINDMLANFAGQMLFELLYFKQLDYSAVFFNYNNALFTKLPIK